MASLTEKLLNDRYQNERIERNRMFSQAKNLIDESEGLLNEVTLTAEIMKQESDTITARTSLIAEQIKNQQLYLDNIILKNKLQYLIKLILNNTPRHEMIEMIESLTVE